MNSIKLLATAALCLLSMGAKAQTSMRITMQDGKQIDYPVSSIANVTWITNEENPDKPDVSPSGVQAVDLGLPSGLKWANMNIGATFPEDYGDYFAWGETEPKDYYNWSTYKWCNGSGTTMTKYCTISNYGKVDNKTTLDPEDDAAHVNWGGAWRMPTYAEQKELLTKCTWNWATVNGKNGHKVTGPNGNYIFLPAAGYLGDNGSSFFTGSDGNFWSSSLYGCYPYALNFNFGDVHWGYYGRCLGSSVRAVCQ